MVSVKLRLFMVAGAVVLLLLLVTLVLTLSVPIVARSQIESTLTDLFKACDACLGLYQSFLRSCGASRYHD
jgi:hypothetical protein